jgi:hypothetical protein
MHLVDNANGLVQIAVLPLGFYCKQRCKLRVFPKAPDTFKDVSRVHLEGLASNDNLSSLELGTRRKLVINDCI